MISHICSKCIHKVEPTSIRDYWLKSLQSPCLRFWGQEEFKHLYWLCSNPNVAEVDHVEHHIIHKPCNEYNFNGNCTFFRTADAIDILPSTIEIEYKKVIPEEDVTEEDTENETAETLSEETPEEDVLRVGDTVEISTKITPFTTPAVTEERQKLDIDGVPMVDEEGNPIMETVEIEPEFVNDQDISYKYQWYKNGRKLFQKKADTLSITLKEEGTEEYFCEITQYIEANGDGGTKVAVAKSNVIELKIEAALPPEEPTEDTPSGDTSTEETDDTN